MVMQLILAQLPAEFVIGAAGRGSEAGKQSHFTCS